MPPDSIAVASKPDPTRAIAAGDLLPAHLLDGGEVVLFAIKPSPWFVLFVSARWLLAVGAIILLSSWVATVIGMSSGAPVVKAALTLGAGRVGFAILEWASRLYVLTNRRVMRIRGVFNINLFDCSLLRIEQTQIVLSWYERLFALGTISFVTTSDRAFEVAWPHVAHPAEVHEQVRAAISRARGMRH